MKWEYLNVSFSSFGGGPEKVTKELNKYGQEGWELVNFQYVHEYELMCFVFKRPIR